MDADDRILARELSRKFGPGQGLVYYDRRTETWKLYVPCGRCAGSILELRADGEDAELTAADAAKELLPDLGMCLRCQAQVIRERRIPLESPLMYFDPELPGWMSWHPFENSDGLDMELGIRLIESRPQALVALSLICQRLPAALAVAETADQLERNLTSILYDHGAGRWMLWFACEDCGGTFLPLSTRSELESMEAAGRALSFLMGAEGCCSCSTAELENEKITVEEGSCRYWFSPSQADWMVAVPVEDSAVIIPAEIGHVDVPVGQLEARICAMLGDPSAT